MAAAHAATAALQWWQHGQALERVVAHLVAGELQRLRRRTLPAGDVRTRLLGLPLDVLAIDSLDLLHLSVALASLLAPRAGLPRLATAPTVFADWLPDCREALAADASQLVFRSSGTTGAGRGAVHETALLWQEAEHLATLVPHRRRVLSVVPAHHIYGFLFSVLLPQALGHLPVIEFDSPLTLAAAWQPGDLVVAYPEFWQAIAALAPQAPPDVVGVTSTAPCPASVAIAVAGLGLRLLQVFGASETAGLGWRDDPDAPYRWFPWWVAGEGAAPEQVRRVLPGGTHHACMLPDRLEPAGPGAFRVAGRRDAVVQVGGVNVSLSAVRAQLLQHPWVADAAVRLMRPEEGQRLKAFVVPHADAPSDPALTEGLARWIADTLPAAERPIALRSGAALPRGDLGKAADWEA